jgi:hypothetical protein
MIKVGGKDFLTSMKEQGLLEVFVDNLYKRQSSQQKQSKDLSPVEWHEMRCTEIKKRALENDVSLTVNKDEITASILNKKQIVIYSNDPETKETLIQNAYLLSGINMHEIPAKKQYRCHLQKDLTDFSTQN